jgi:hypothetical protein
MLQVVLPPLALHNIFFLSSLQLFGSITRIGGVNMSKKHTVPCWSIAKKTAQICQLITSRKFAGFAIKNLSSLNVYAAGCNQPKAGITVSCHM